MVNHIRRAVYLAMRLLYITNSNSLLREWVHQLQWPTDHLTGAA
jgi:hypothetical protein